MRTKTSATRRSFGAQPLAGATRFSVWAPRAAGVSVLVESGSRAGEHAMARAETGTFSATVRGIGPGDLYRYRVDGSAPMPDPASRFQPLGVHGPSEVIDPAAYRWNDEGWCGVDPARAVIYELHVGTFTVEGTFRAAAARLPYLRDLGVTIVELMPVADFPGTRNWGYDGVDLYAPARVYGRPDDLRRFVEDAHRNGLGVMLDVVYNHLGPDGAYMNAFAPSFFTSRHASAWGDGVNLDGPDSPMVRRFIVENAMHWIDEYHADGLRLDATHALADDSPTPIVAEIVAEVRAAAGRPVMIVAEDHRNLATMVREPEEGGWGLDGIWADDFHHIMRRILAGDSEGYYEDYRPSVEDLAATLRQGWFYTGQRSRHLSAPRGTDPAGIAPRKFVICLQNHDQIGNRAYGDRLHHSIPLAAYRAASAVLLAAPMTPLLFMGQEWAARAPFRYFTDHTTELGRAIVDGRRKEFERFSAFRDPALRERIPSPQDAATFEASRLDWSEAAMPPHVGVHRLYRKLLGLREAGLRMADGARGRAAIEAVDADTLSIEYAAGASRLRIVARLRGAGTVELPGLPSHARVLFTTEDPEYAPGGLPPELSRGRLHFPTTAAVGIAFTR